MANSVDPEKMSHLQHLIWVYTFCRGLPGPTLRDITVNCTSRYMLPAKTQISLCNCTVGGVGEGGEIFSKLLSVDHHLHQWKCKGNGSILRKTIDIFCNLSQHRTYPTCITIVLYVLTVSKNG